MNQDFENPFVDYGNIVRGERFIGREDNLRVIENRVIRPREAGNLAIIGEPRIGKSSLVYNAIIERKDELIAKKFLPIWINLATYDQAPLFFRSLVTRCVDEMEDLDWLSKPVRRAVDRVLQDELVLFILDEFDNARHLFRGDISGFQGLRELSYRPEWRVTYITTSRRTIRDIELQTQAISTFDGIFHKHYLSMFGEEDLQEYFARLSSIGISATSALKEHVTFYCGGHPYLLEMLGYEIIEVFRDKQRIDAEKAAQRIAQDFLSQYDRMVDLLREDGSLSKLLQVLFGPIVDVKQTDVDELLRYGFIKPGEQDTYVAFSGHFQTFLSLVEREVDLDLWPIWRETETALRHLVSTTMLEQYGERWIEKLEKARPNLKAIFEQCRHAQKKEEKSFGSRASRNLIDFTYPQDLFAIIFAEWNTFKAVFGKDKNYWAQRSDLLAKIRNPLAHNRDKSLYDYERQIAEGYSKEILTAIKLAGDA
jgi:AAA+ ATPase superfamily predicted ATPase